MKDTNPQHPLTGQHAIVTGGAVRIGREIVLRLARAGAAVSVHYGRSAAAATELVDALHMEGVQAHAVQGDLAAPDCPSIIERAAELAPVTILVNSAARFDPGNLETSDLDNWDLQFAVNLRAPFLLAQAFARQLPADREGNIVNILDARSQCAGADHFAYRLTKVALEAMTRNLALDLAPRVRVNGVAPGAILPPPGAPQAHLDRIAADRVPLQRPGAPEQIAEAVVHLLQQPFATGVCFPLDGGEFL